MSFLGSAGDLFNRAKDGAKNVVSGAKNLVTGGINQVKSTAKDAAAMAAGLAFMAALAGAAYTVFKNATYRNFILNGLLITSRAPTSQKIAVWLMLIIVIGAILAVHYFSKQYRRLAYFSPIDSIYGPIKSMGILDEGFEMKAEDASMLSSQPRSIANAGLYNPTAFEPKEAIQHALQAGFRSFVLYIDYKDSDPNTPLLVYRDADGSIIATGSINEFSTSIMFNAFRSDMSVPNVSQPILVYLHILRSPSPVTAPQGYKKFLGAIAAEIQPMAPNHLGATSFGKFNRQKEQDTLLTIPLATIGPQVIILCNADTSARSSTDPSKDLDYYVNMRVYLEDPTMKGLGVTQPYSGSSSPSAVVTKMSAIDALDSAAADTFALKGKNRFVIALPEAKTNPTIGSLKKGMNLGINMIPMNMILETPDTAKELVAAYANKSWPSKPAHLI